MYILCCFFFKQKTAYEMRISEWSSDVCSSDLDGGRTHLGHRLLQALDPSQDLAAGTDDRVKGVLDRPGLVPLVPVLVLVRLRLCGDLVRIPDVVDVVPRKRHGATSCVCQVGSRSEEHTSELQSLMRISYAVFCLHKKTIITTTHKSKI